MSIYCSSGYFCTMADFGDIYSIVVMVLFRILWTISIVAFIDQLI